MRRLRAPLSCATAEQVLACGTCSIQGRNQACLVHEKNQRVQRVLAEGARHSYCYSARQPQQGLRDVSDSGHGVQSGEGAVPNCSGEGHMLTNNLHQEVGLVNGVREEVVDIVCARGKPTPAPPPYVLVKFDG